MNMDRAMRWVDDQVEAIKEPFVRFYDRLFWRMLMRRGKRRQMAESTQYDNAPHFMKSVLQRLSKLCSLLEGLEWHAHIIRDKDGGITFSQVHFVPKVCKRADNGELGIDKYGVVNTLETEEQVRQRHQQGLYSSRDFNDSGCLKIEEPFYRVIADDLLN